MTVCWTFISFLHWTHALLCCDFPSGIQRKATNSLVRTEDSPQDSLQSSLTQHQWWQLWMRSSSRMSFSFSLCTAGSLRLMFRQLMRDWDHSLELAKLCYQGTRFFWSFVVSLTTANWRLDDDERREMSVWAALLTCKLWAPCSVYIFEETERCCNHFSQTLVKGSCIIIDSWLDYMYFNCLLFLSIESLQLLRL